MNIVSHSKCSKCKQITHEAELVRDEVTGRLICKDVVRCAANKLKKQNTNDVNAT